MSQTLGTTDEILSALGRFKMLHGGEYALTALGIFGSHARGEASEASDVDIVFETSSPNLLVTSRMKQEIEELLGRRIDLVRLREHMNASLREHILRDAKYV